MKKLRKRAGSLLLVLLMALSNFTPYTAYGGVQAGSNDNDAGGQRIPATYNMHGWGAVVTLVSVDNTYIGKDAELDKFAADFASGNETSMAITHLTEQKYLAEFPDFWMQSGTGANSCLIFIAPTGKDVGAKNSFVGTDGMEKGTAIPNAYRADQGSSGNQIKVIADAIRADEDLLTKFKNKDLSWATVKSLTAASSTLESSKKNFIGMFKNTANTATLLNNLLKNDDSIDDALQYLDVLITVQSLIGGVKCTDVIKDYLEGLNQNSASRFALVSIASVVSNSSDSPWLWYTIPSYYAQFKNTSAVIPTDIIGSSIDVFFDEYEAIVSGTSFSGNAASLKSHRAWAWWHTQKGRL